MISEIQPKIDPHLPLKIKKASWNDPILHFYGKEWSFYTLAAWRLYFNDTFKYGSFDGKNPEIARILRHTSISKISVQCPNFPVDPLFYFADGHVLEIFSDASYDTWTIHLPNNVVYDFVYEGGEMLKTKKIEKLGELTDFLPLIIDSVLVEDERFTLLGKNWKFSTRSAWRIHSKSNFVGMCELDGLIRFPDLKNCSIDSIQIQSYQYPVDPVLFLSNGYTLEVFSASHKQPWLLELPNGKSISSFS